jgi:predicted membrane protein
MTEPGPAGGPVRTGHVFTPRIILGIFLIVLGILFTLDNLDVLESESIWDYWPVILIAIGLSKIWQSPRGRGRGTGYILIFFGVVLLLNSLEIVPWDVWKLSPLLLVVLGIIVIQRSRVSRAEARQAYEDSSATIHALAFLSGVRRRSTSREFRGAELTAIMGGCEVDLTGADIAAGEAVIDTFAFWGGIDIRVPPEWEVVVKGMPLMGGYDDQTRSEAGEAEGPRKRLVVKGLAVMGGVDVKN